MLLIPRFAVRRARNVATVPGANGTCEFAERHFESAAAVAR